MLQIYSDFSLTLFPQTLSNHLDLSFISEFILDLVLMKKTVFFGIFLLYAPNLFRFFAHAFSVCAILITHTAFDWLFRHALLSIKTSTRFLKGSNKVIVYISIPYYRLLKLILHIFIKFRITEQNFVIILYKYTLSHTRPLTSVRTKLHFRQGEFVMRSYCSKIIAS